MTKISYIHGFGGQLPADEWSDRSKNVAQAQFLNYTGMTAGELKLSLLYDQLSIFAAYYPENKDYQAAKNTVENILYAGLGNVPISTTGTSDLTRFVNKVAAKAKKQTRPVGFIKPKDKTILAAKNFVFATKENIGDPLIPFNCDDYIAYEWTPSGDVVVYPQGSWAYDQCQKQLEYVNLLNQSLEKSAHHLLYTYIKNPSAQPATVAAKYVNHTLAIATLAEVCALPTEEMRLWLRNGVIRNNVRVGAPPEQPEDTYQALKTHWTQQGGSVQGFQALLPVILQIIGAIITAIGATKALVDSLRQSDRQRMENTAKAIGSAPFGPEDVDFAGWTPSSSGIDTGNIDFLTLGLLAGGGLIAYKMLD